MKSLSRKTVGDLTLISCLTVVIYLTAGYFDLLERLYSVSRAHEAWEVDELLTTGIFVSLLLIWFSWRRWTDASRAERSLRQQNRQLSQAVEEIQRLRGIVPICSHCKNIRDDEGFWHQVERYIEEHSPARFTHGICPSCVKEHYPELAAKREQID